MKRPPHRRGRYDEHAKAIRAAANANPSTRCWRCGRTLAEHPRHKTGKAVRWTAGHIRDSDPTSPLAPEASTCNYRAGASYGNALRVDQHSERW